AYAGIVRPIWTAIDNFAPGVWTCLYNEANVGIPIVDLKNQSTDYTINPNPAEVEAVLSFSKKPEKQTGTITDAAGRIIRSFDVGGRSEIHFDLQNFPDGIYFVHVGGSTRKLIVR